MVTSAIGKGDRLLVGLRFVSPLSPLPCISGDGMGDTGMERLTLFSRKMVRDKLTGKLV
jgi:hypothetical protein